MSEEVDVSTPSSPDEQGGSDGKRRRRRRRRRRGNNSGQAAASGGAFPDDVLVAVSSVSFDASVMELFLPLSVGGKCVVASHEAAADGVQLLRLMDQHAVNVIHATPSTWRIMLAGGWERSPKLTVHTTGEA